MDCCLKGLSHHQKSTLLGSKSFVCLFSVIADCHKIAHATFCIFKQIYKKVDLYVALLKTFIAASLYYCKMISSIFQKILMKTRSFSWCKYLKVCFLPSDNGFSQIFCNCFHLDEIFSWHNGAISLSQNVQQKF